MGKIICLSQYKGGTGKTSSTLNIAACMVRNGYKVLVVDLDQQANLTVWLGHQPNELSGKTVKTLLTDEMDKLQAEDFVLHTSENIDLLPASIELVQAEMALQSMVASEKQLALKLEPLVDRYNFILLDTPPAPGQIGTNALTSADYLLIPVQPEPQCLQGLSHLTYTYDLVRRRLNQNLNLMGMFITLLANTKLHSAMNEQLRESWGSKVFQSEIKRQIAIAEAAANCQSIFSYSPKSEAAANYQTLTEEVIKHAS